MKKFIIRAALHEEANEGWGWQGEFPSRTTVRITRHKDGKKFCVFCQTRRIDSNFRDRYNQSQEEKERLRKANKKCRIDIQLDRADQTMVLGEWYRDALGRFGTTEADNETGLVELEITAYDKGWKRWWGPFRAAAHHPDIVVRIGTALGVLGFGLGLVGLLPYALSIFGFSEASQPCVVLVGAALVGILGWTSCRRPKLVR